MDGPEWENISNSAKDLLKKMISYDQRRRIQAKDILKHKWFKEFLNKEDSDCIDLSDTI